jgi:hypothetical protein
MDYGPLFPNGFGQVPLTESEIIGVGLDRMNLCVNCRF